MKNTLSRKLGAYAVAAGAVTLAGQTASADIMSDLTDNGLFSPGGVRGVFLMDPYLLTSGPYAGNYNYVIDLYNNGGGSQVYHIEGFDPADALFTGVWDDDDGDNDWHPGSDYTGSSEKFDYLSPITNGFEVPNTAPGGVYSHGPGLLWTAQIVLPDFYDRGEMFAACDYDPDDITVLWPDETPEPMTLGLLALGATGLLARRKRA